MISVGKFSKVLNSEGVLLFKSFFKDSSFLLNEKSLFHSVLGTEFNVQFIKKSAKGFRVKFKEVSNQKEASFFINEIFSLPKDRIEGKSLDLVVGKKVFDKNSVFLGTVDSFSDTPDYPLLLVVNNEKEFFVPFTETFCKIENGNIFLQRFYDAN